jgi:hypothetical protein
MAVSEELRSATELLSAAAAAARLPEAKEYMIVVAFRYEGRPRAAGFNDNKAARAFLEERGIEPSDAVMVDRRTNKHIIWMT